jgi:hypothetical protein
MADWKYTLKVKDLLDPDAADTNAHAAVIAPQIQARVKALMVVVEADNEDLYCQLDEVSDMLDGVGKTLPRWACKELDEALSVLYDTGDEHRVWVE